jgi:hypothetical protein
LEHVGEEYFVSALTLLSRSSSLRSHSKSE